MRLSLIPYNNIVGMDYSSDGYGLFGGGTTGSNSAYTDKYVYNNAAVIPGIVLGLARSYLATCGNSIVGIFGGGNTGSNSAYTDKYTFSNNVVTPGTLLGLARNDFGACGNSIIGIFGGGYAATQSAYTDKYTFSNNVVAAGTVLATARNGLTACGDSIVGIFGGGWTGSYTAYTDKYTYSNNVVAAGTVLGTAREGMAACANNTFGIFGGGWTGNRYNITDKYTFNDNSVASGTVLGLARNLLAATGTSSIGIFGGGYTGSNSAYTDKYIYSNNAVSQGTNLGLARYGLAAVSSQPCSLSYLNIKVAEAYYPLRVKYPTQTKLMISGNERIFDSMGKAITVYGNTAISTTQSIIGGSSIYFDGSGDYLTLANSADWNFGSGDFTIDFWLKTGNAPSGWFLLYWVPGSPPYDGGYVVGLSSSKIWMYWDYGNTPLITGPGASHDLYGTTTLSDNGWHHIAVCRYGSTWKLYYHGIAEDTKTYTDTIDYQNANPFTINSSFAGYLSHIRITKGVALWTSNFTPPSKIADYYQTTGYLGR